MMARSSRKLPAECLFSDGDAELFEDPLRQIDQPPTDHTVDCRDRTALDHPRLCLALNVVELGGVSGRFPIKQAVGPPPINPHPPTPDDLNPNPADLRGLRARCTVIDHRK